MQLDNQKPFPVPPFDPGIREPKVRYYWWSWNPYYPYWSRSCWGGETVDEAWADISKPNACKMRFYHNKLIREGDGNFTEVADYPCQDTSHWWDAQKKMEQKQINC